LFAGGFMRLIKFRQLEVIKPDAATAALANIHFNVPHVYLL
jgi:hypothetical protein